MSDTTDMTRRDPFGLDDEHDARVRPARSRARRRQIEPGVGSTGKVEAPRGTFRLRDITVTLRAGNPLIVAGREMLRLAWRLHEQADDIPSLDLIQDDAKAALDRYQDKMENGRIPPALAGQGEYLLCRLLDDLALNGPWKGKNEWRASPLVRQREGDAGRAEDIFGLIDRVLSDRSDDLELAELLLVMLSLGFEGELRTDLRGPILLDEHKERLLSQVRNRGAVDAQRSSVSGRQRTETHKRLTYVNPVSFFGTLALVAAAIASLVMLYMDLTSTAPEESEVVAGIGAPEPFVVPIPSRGASARALEARARNVFRPDIDRGDLRLDLTPEAISVFITKDAVRDAGSPVLRESALDMIQRIAAVAGLTRGDIIVVEFVDAGADKGVHYGDLLGDAIADWVPGDRTVTATRLAVQPDTPASSLFAVIIRKDVRVSRVADLSRFQVYWY